MELFETQEIGSLPKPTLEDMAIYGSKLKLDLLEFEDITQKRSDFNLKFLKSIGLNYIFDGEAHRIEMAEHPYRSIVGANFIGHVRSFDNKYFRKASVVNVPIIRNPYHSDEYKFITRLCNDSVLKIPVTGAYTLAEWAYNDYYISQENNQYSRYSRKNAQVNLVHALARNVIRPTIEDLIRHGAHRIQIDEPALGTHPDETILAVKGFEESVKGLDADFSIHICYSDYAKMFPAILEAKSCKEWTWEFANRETSLYDPYSILELFKEYKDNRRIGLGVLDVHINTIESAETVCDRILRASKYLDNPELIRVNPDCGLRTRSWNVIHQKLSNMVIGASLARKTI